MEINKMRLLNNKSSSCSLQYFKIEDYWISVRTYSYSVVNFVDNPKKRRLKETEVGSNESSPLAAEAFFAIADFLFPSYSIIHIHYN